LAVKRFVYINTSVIFFLITAIIFNVSTFVFANALSDQPASYVTGLDLSEGRIFGDKVEYTMEIPENWIGFILVEREELSPGTRILEMLNFYWQPRNQPLIFLASIYVYETKYSMDFASYKRILETNEYDFRIYVSATEMEFLGTVDKIVYNHFIEQFGDMNLILELFSFPEGRGPVVKERLFVNGGEVEGSVVYGNDVVYVPLRAVCEALGYTLVWYGSDQSIYMEKNGFEFTLYTGDKINYGAVRIENEFFVPAVFFIQVLQVNFETDRRGNVFLTERM